MSDRTCYIDFECSERGGITRGLCSRHYARLNRYGDPLGRPAPKAQRKPRSVVYRAADADPRADRRQRQPDLPGEVWIPVPDFVGLYEASSMGRVRGLDRINTHGRFIPGCILKGAPDGTGRLRISLWRNGHPHHSLVHKIIMRTFVGPCPPGQVTRHGPNGLRDNSLANLCYGTFTENMHDKTRDGTQPMGREVWNARLTDEAVRDMRALYAAGGVTQRELSVRYGVGRRTVGKALSREKWKHVA
jgi:hypothetical protein